MDILQWFIKNFPSYVTRMKECSYHYDEYNMNLHHMEGNVWTHTVLSLKNAINNNYSIYIQYALLLHDIGRIYTRNADEEDKKVYFGDFEGVSCYMALDILNTTSLSENEKVRILKIISHHYAMIEYIKFDNPSMSKMLHDFKYEEELLYDLALYVQCDLNGRVIDESLSHLYDLKKIDNTIDELNNIEKNYQKEKVSKNIAYILVGPPNSGKSTWVSKQQFDYLLVSRDKAILDIGKKYNQHSYDDAYDLMKANKAIKNEVDKLDEMLEGEAKKSTHQNIIIDNPNLKQKNRFEFIDILKKSHYIKVIVFLTPLVDLFELNKKREMIENKSIDQKTIIKKLKTFSFPLYSEGIDDIEYIFSIQ